MLFLYVFYIFTPGFVVFLLGFIILYVLTLDNKVLLWDELRLCGAYPKLLLVLILRILVYMN